jgi:hypothetical protein
MSRQSRDPWRLGVLDRIGAQLRELENTEANQRRRRRISISGGLVAAVLATFALLNMGQLADALSPINRAPAAAAASESVHFRSTIKIVLNGRQHERFTEHGEIDFAKGDFSTTLSLGQAGGVLERRIADGVFYIAQLRRGRRPGGPVHWLALRLAGGQRASFSSAPEGDAFTDPPVLFRAMAGTRAPVTTVGHEDIDGVPTTHYRLFTDLAAFLHASSPTAEVSLSYRKVAATLDVWLDGRGRPRRVDEAFAGASALGLARITTRIDFTGYGQPVAVRAPASTSVTSQRQIATPGPLFGDPSRLFERLMLTRP